MSPLLAFYRGLGADAAGRTIDDIWRWDHRRLEMVHDYIQWLFPLTEPSRFNPDAPLLSPGDMAAFRTDADLQARVRRSLDLMLGFFGLEREDSRIVSTPRTADWLTPLNHNHLRLTRIITFLRLAGLEPDARALFACLDEIAADAAAISPRTRAFWREAASVQP